MKHCLESIPKESIPGKVDLHILFVLIIYILYLLIFEILLILMTSTLCLAWLRAHIGQVGNERADQLAKLPASSSTLECVSLPCSIAFCKVTNNDACNSSME